MPFVFLLILGLVAGCDKKVVRSVDVPVEEVSVGDTPIEDVLANSGLMCPGSLHLPMGAGMIAEELQVISLFGAAKPNAAGAFTISMADSRSPQFVFATDPATDNSLLLGYIDPQQSEHVHLSCESTAVGLAFLSPLMIGTTAEQRVYKRDQGTPEFLAFSGGGRSDFQSRSAAYARRHNPSRTLPTSR